MARQPPTLVPEATPLNARQRGVDANAKSVGNTERLQLSATSPHHREVVSGGSHHALRPADGCADAEAPLAGPHPSDACRPPSAPCGVGTGPTRWTAISTWQYPDGHAPLTNGTTVLFLEIFINGPTPPLTFQKWANNYGCRPILLRI